MIRGSGSLTLGEFAALYERRRGQSGQNGTWRKSHKPITDATLRIHTMALKYLTAYFGEDRPVDALPPMEIEDWLDAMAKGRLNHIRQWQRPGGPPSRQTMGKLIRSCHAIFEWARRNGIVESNPFADFSGQVGQRAPNRYVTEAETEKLCLAATRIEWETLVRLCRFAGLRRGEALILRWPQIDWQRCRMGFTSPKTGHYREVPISPGLQDHLLRRFELAEAGQQRVVPLSEHNLGRKANEAMDRAGLERWSKPYQSLRSSWENDLKQMGIAEATYLAWMGHGQTVSRTHYVAPTEDEFRRITGEDE